MRLSSNRLHPIPIHLSMLLCLSLLAACSSPPADQTAGGSGGSGGVGGSGTVGTGGAGGGAVTGGVGGFVAASTTASTSSTGIDAGPECMSAPYETDIVLTLPGGQTPMCSVGNHDLTGVVVDSGSPTEILIDTCVPGTGCAPAIARLSVTSPGLTFSVPTGSFARIQYSDYWTFSCAKVVIVSEVDSFGGMMDPMAQDRVWLIVSADQPIQMLDTSPVRFAIDFDKLNCPITPAGCGTLEEPGIYTLHVSDNINPSAQRTVYMGETSTDFPSGGWKYDIYNNRTSYYGGCDETFARRYWIKLSGI